MTENDRPSVQTNEKNETEDLRLLEALLFASSEILKEEDLALYFKEGTNVPKLLLQLQHLYANRGITLEKKDTFWGFRTAEDLAEKLSPLVVVPKKLSRAATETLAIIAYHQPVTRSEIEEVRGVNVAKGTLDILLESDWVKPVGRRESAGRPLMWGTTEFFLDYFHLSSLDDLPKKEELERAGLLEPRRSLFPFSKKEEEAKDRSQKEDSES